MFLDGIEWLFFFDLEIWWRFLIWYCSLPPMTLWTKKPNFLDMNQLKPIYLSIFSRDPKPTLEIGKTNRTTAIVTPLVHHIQQHNNTQQHHNNSQQQTMLNNNTKYINNISSCSSRSDFNRDDASTHQVIKEQRMANF